MSLAKTAQNLDGFSVPMAMPKPESQVVQPALTPQNPFQTSPTEPEPLDSALADDAQGTLLIQVDDGEPVEMFDFTLPLVPGGADQSDLDPATIEVEEDEEIEVESDPWKWNVGSFLSWLQNMLQGIPSHSGKDTAGCERAIAYLEVLDKEISKAVRMDLKNEIAIDAVEKARDEIHKGLDRLYDRLDRLMENKYPKRKGKKKKKADEAHEMTKEASKATRINGITITVPLFISGIVRTCLNSMVSAGKDLEDCFEKLSTKYNLTDREVFEAIQLFSDMGYAIRRPRGYDLDEEIDYTSTDNLDWNANYPG
jgi:hypothetical protein